MREEVAPAVRMDTNVSVILRIEDLHTYFYTPDGIVKAVNGIDLDIGGCETLGLVGESGCGKSVTALSIMRLIAKPQGRIVRGSMFFGDLDLCTIPERAMRMMRGNRISMIYQEPMTSLNPVFSIGNQIVEAIRLHKAVSKRDALILASEMLNMVGIPNPRRRLKEYPHQMSGGMRQRVMIAMALACNPELLIADEPTTALDVTIQAQVLKLMDDLKADMGASILLITHDLAVIAEMAQRVAVMYAGRIVESAEVVEFFNRPLHPYTVGLMASIPRMDQPVPEDRLLQTIPGVVPSLVGLPDGCAFYDRCLSQSNECLERFPRLKEVSPGHWVRCLEYA